MTARVFENAASPAGDGVEIDMLDPPTAQALKPRPSLLVPNHQNGLPVDQNIRCPSGEQAPPVVAPLEPRDRPFGERAGAVEFERIEAEPVLDQTVGGEVGLVIARYHDGEINCGDSLFELSHQPLHFQTEAKNQNTISAHRSRP